MTPSKRSSQASPYKDVLNADTVAELTEAQLKTHVSKWFRDEKCAHVLDLTIRNLIKDNGAGEERFKIMTVVLKSLQKTDIPGKVVQCVSSSLRICVDGLTAEQLKQLVELCVTGFQKYGTGIDRWKDVFSKLLNIVTAKDKILHNGVTLNGQEYKEEIVRVILNTAWEADSTSAIVDMFREISLNTEEICQVIHKSSKSLLKLGPHEVPPLVYQLLLISNDSQSACALLQALDTYFTKICEEEDPSSDVQEAKGTAIYHIIQHDEHPLFKELLRILRAGIHCPALALGPFIFSLSMAATSLDYLKDKVLDQLKMVIVKCFADEQRYSYSVWFSAQIDSDVEAHKVVLGCVKNSGSEWGYLMNGMVDLAFALLALNNTNKTETYINEVWALGSEILTAVVKRQSDMASAVLEVLVKKIIRADGEQYVGVLDKLTKESFKAVLQCNSQLKNLLQKLCTLGVQKARQTISAILPILHLSPSLQDTLMLTLRKTMYRHSTEDQRIAVIGYLILLERIDDLSGALSSSQLEEMTMSQQMFSRNDSKELICFELIQLLTYCISKEFPVKESVYKGLSDIVLENGDIGIELLNMLMPVFNTFYVTNEDRMPPLKFSKTVAGDNGNMTMIEPLGCLVHCLHCICHALNTHNDADKDIVTECKRKLDSVALRMSECELDDFEMEQNEESSQSAGAHSKLAQAVQICQTYETLLEYKYFCGADTNRDLAEEMISLFKGYVKVSSVLKKASSVKAGPGRKKANDTTAAPKSVDKLKFNVPTSLLTFRFIKAFCHSTYSETPSHNILKRFSCMTVHVLQAAQCRLHSIKEIGSCIEILPMLFSFVLNQIERELDQDQWKVIYAVLEFLLILLNTVQRRYPEKLDSFLCAIGGTEGEDSTENAVSCIKKLQDVVKHLQIDAEEESHQRAFVLAFRLMDVLSKQLSPGENDIKEISAWNDKFCAESISYSKPACQSAVEFLLHSLAKSNTSSSYIVTFSRQFHSQLGDTEDDVVMEECMPYKIIRNELAQSTYGHLLSEIDRILDNVEVAIGRLTAIALHSLCNVDCGELEKRQKSIANQLGNLANGLTELVQTASNDAACIDATARTVTHFYTALTSLAKHFLDQCSKKKIITVSGNRFDKLGAIAGNQLKKKVEKFFLYAEAFQTRVQQKSLKKAKKPAKNSKISFRETKRLPQLVFEMEQFEKCLIQLSKKTKIDLMEGTRMSTSRDFRIIAKNINIDPPEEDADESVPSTLNDTDQQPGSQPSTSQSKRIASSPLKNPSKKRTKK